MPVCETKQRGNDLRICVHSFTREKHDLHAIHTSTLTSYVHTYVSSSMSMRVWKCCCLAVYFCIPRDPIFTLIIICLLLTKIYAWNCECFFGDKYEPLCLDKTISCSGKSCENVRVEGSLLYNPLIWNVYLPNLNFKLWEYSSYFILEKSFTFNSSPTTVLYWSVYFASMLLKSCVYSVQFNYLAFYITK